MSQAKDRESIVVHPVTPDRWPDLLALAEKPGPRGGTPILGACWCGGWTGNTRHGSALRKQSVRDLACHGHPPGLRAYRDGEAVGWAAVGRRTTLAGLERARVMRGRPDDDAPYAIMCLFVSPDMRGQGVSGALLDGAIRFAREQ